MFECEVADEPVVVSKARPMKASKWRVKPSRLSALFHFSQKLKWIAKGGSRL